MIASNDYEVRDQGGKILEQGKLDRGDVLHQQNFVDAVRGNGSLNAEVAEGRQHATLPLGQHRLPQRPYREHRSDDSHDQRRRRAAATLVPRVRPRLAAKSVSSPRQRRRIIATVPTALQLHPA
ncbi:MAG: hypothetical protein R3C10_27010 [Pirellulales bacterium]